MRERERERESKRKLRGCKRVGGSTACTSSARAVRLGGLLLLSERLRLAASKGMERCARRDRALCASREACASRLPPISKSTPNQGLQRVNFVAVLEREILPCAVPS